MNKVNHGHIRMPESHVNQSITRFCNVTFSGSANGIIVFHHQRLSNATRGLCLKDGVINDDIYEGSCSDQRVHFSKVTTITLSVRKPIQDNFILHFTGIEKLAHDNKSALRSNQLCISVYTQKKVSAQIIPACYQRTHSVKIASLYL